MKKNIFSALLIASMITGTTISYAATSNFGSKFVDSNVYTKVTTATKETTSDDVTVYIETMYKSNNGVKGEEATNYDELYVQLGGSGEQASSKLVTKGKSKDFSLVTKYKAKGTTLSMYAKGHDPSLDCYVDGSFNAH